MDNTGQFLITHTPKEGINTSLFPLLFHLKTTIVLGCKKPSPHLHHSALESVFRPPAVSPYKPAK